MPADLLEKGRSMLIGSGTQAAKWMEHPSALRILSVVNGDGGAH